MKITVYQSMFVDQFVAIRPDNFSYAGLCALFEMLEDCECEGFEYELDVIGICCEYSEYDSALACLEECGYNFTPDADDDKEDQEDAALDYLRDETCIVEFDGGIIIQSF